ncbi:DUF4350 domain-containing protein [Cronbergia sp. UHCC 0137]|uniref:DUF4350 domain-containing protein n=1 Tax=Cronbergia sp. UHCC 0137 TaxID=3110239 RepID=UPI002B21FB1B|nr:DUF4350 domain-containing protein [Cronbergia sp. UHCC 0137]MEA5619698.1 DUF4350 domain-containing protein [Cronbergia sp. UHCC 0137]
MKRNYRVRWLGGIALAAIIILSLIAAPQSKILSGSTYNVAPDGYGAWYAFMQKQGTSIQRWQKPVSDFPPAETGVTLLQVYSNLQEPIIYGKPEEWVKKGNTLVILGVKRPVTAARFTTFQPSTVGDIKIDTRRRHRKSSEEEIVLSDRYGAIVWEKDYGKGKIIFAITPHLAANAYQDNTGNFPYLADLVTKNSKKIFVDEYIHGYKDQDVKQKEREGDLLNYFAKTPVLLVLFQAGVLLLVLIWAKNQRFGKPITLETPIIDNSQAYIQALAAVLQKAESTDFVLEILGKEEQHQLQKVLGLGQIPVEKQVLLQVWEEKTGINPTELDTALKLQNTKLRISEQQLLSWLRKWRTIRETIAGVRSQESGVRIKTLL